MARRNAGRRIDGEREPMETRLARLVDAWIMARSGGGGPNDDSPPDRALATRLESDIHHLIRDEAPTTMFDFAGLAIWIDPATPTGHVRQAELVRLS